jgi:hypothetical protein
VVDFFYVYTKQKALPSPTCSPVTSQALKPCKLVVRPNARLEQIFEIFTEHRDRVAIMHYGGHAGEDRLCLESARCRFSASPLLAQATHQINGDGPKPQFTKTAAVAPFCQFSSGISGILRSN